MAVPLTDSYGRVHRDLRISVTDRCDFRCTYCMPEEGLRWLPREDVLSYEEIERIARVCVERFGFDSIRLTGGEPLVRHRLPVLVGKLAALGVDVAITTNGASLTPKVAAEMKAAGLARINISLDTLRPDRFVELTRRDALDDVLAGIDAAIAAGLRPVKVNAVLMRGVNDDEVVDLAAFGRDKGVTVRFIEFMPLDAQGGWKADSVVSRDEIVSAVGAVFPLEGVGHHGHDPAQSWRYLDGKGEIGVIPTVTDAFCSSCDRVRLTADGQLRACLFAIEETDLRAILRSELTGEALDDALTDAIARTVAGKWAGHGISEVTFSRPRRSMSQIGG